MKKKESSLINKVWSGGHDSPVIKDNDATFMIPDLEVLVYPNAKELEKAWYSEEPNFILDKGGDLWGFYDITGAPPIRIHIRSVRSHRNKEEFFHTLGHELAHIMEHQIQSQKPTIGYRKAILKRIGQDAKTYCILAWIETCEAHKDNWFGKVLKRVERTVGRIHSKIRKE